MRQWCLFIKKKRKKNKKHVETIQIWFPGKQNAPPRKTVTRNIKIIIKKLICQVILKIEHQNKIKKCYRYGINNMAKKTTLLATRERKDKKVHCNKRKTVKCWSKYIYLLHLSCFQAIKSWCNLQKYPEKSNISWQFLKSTHTERLCYIRADPEVTICYK